MKKFQPINLSFQILYEKNICLYIPVQINFLCLPVVEQFYRILESQVPCTTLHRLIYYFQYYAIIHRYIRMLLQLMGSGVMIINLCIFFCLSVLYRQRNFFVLWELFEEGTNGTFQKHSIAGHQVILRIGILYLGQVCTFLASALQVKLFLYWAYALY